MAGYPLEWITGGKEEKKTMWDSEAKKGLLDGEHPDSIVVLCASLNHLMLWFCLECSWTRRSVTPHRHNQLVNGYRELRKLCVFGLCNWWKLASGLVMDLMTH